MKQVAEALEYYLKVGNWLLAVPFNATRNVNTGLYECKSRSRLLQILTALFQATSVCLMIVCDWAGTYNYQTLKNCVYLAFNLYVGIGSLHIWKSSKSFERVLKSIHRLEISFKEANIEIISTKPLILATSLAVIYVLSTAIVTFLTSYVGLHLAPQINQFYIGHAYILVYGKRNCTDFIVNPTEECRANAGIILMGIVILISAGGTLVLSMYINMMCFISAAVLWYFANVLLHHMKSSKPLPSGTMIRLANEALEMCEVMEETMSTIVIFFCLALVPFYSLGMQVVLSQNDIFKCVRYSLSILVFVTILLVAADANSKMKKVGGMIAARTSPDLVSNVQPKLEIMDKDWSICQESILVLLHRLTENEYGLQGKAFTITYGLVGNVAGVVVTYAIMMYQFRGS